ncbi:alpha/beta hydrolase [Cupriavidus lacunae]|uniref:alpha/beta hydrolase n=1 Tax=Cupriavidus lacunae TaxID=2666307 RepID=UPI001FC9DB33|nr:alpha/beta hydrolase [Cupriavidus lacunae]
MGSRPYRQQDCHFAVSWGNHDPYAAISYAQSRASTSGSGLLDVGARGHLNAASQLDDLVEGYRLLQHFDASAPT